MTESDMQEESGPQGFLVVKNRHLLEMRGDEEVFCVHPDCGRKIQRKYACGDFFSPRDEICIMCRACVSITGRDHLPRTHRVIKDRFIFCPEARSVKESGNHFGICPACRGAFSKTPLQKAIIESYLGLDGAKPAPQLQVRR